MKQPEFKAIYDDTPVGFWQDDMRWQAQWYTGTTYHSDGYERGGYYATEEDALEAAKQGKANQDMFANLFAAATSTDEATEQIEIIEGDAIEPMDCDCVFPCALIDTDECNGLTRTAEPRGTSERAEDIVMSIPLPGGEVCPRCGGDGFDHAYATHCSECNGHGVL